MPVAQKCLCSAFPIFLACVTKRQPQARKTVRGHTSQRLKRPEAWLWGLWLHPSIGERALKQGLCL